MYVGTDLCWLAQVVSDHSRVVLGQAVCPELPMTADERDRVGMFWVQSRYLQV